MDYYVLNLKERYPFLPAEDNAPLLGENPNGCDSF